MAKSRQSLVQDKIVDMTECSICAEIFTNPKILPCVHTFCLGCLETYGKDKQPGEQIACPLCRTKLLIPAGGLCNLPNNFFIGKMVEIGKLAATPVNEATCNVCPEGEEALANMYCIDCEQNLCERCSKSHKRTKFTQNHQIVELGGRATAQELNFCNSYCDHHPNELVKMYCYDDKEAICLICCVESHQSHRCVNVGKAAEEFTKRLKDDLKMVNSRLPECGEIVEKLDRYKAEFLGEILNAEKSARDIGNKLKALIDLHTEILINNLKSLSEMKVKAFETTKQDVDRFKVMVDSFSRFCEELLSRGSPVDICRTANQMQTRAAELENLPANCSGDCLRYETVVFHSSSFEDILKQTRSSNVVGEIKVIELPDKTLKFEIERKGTAIDVLNIPENMTEAVLHMIMENRRLGGGYEVTNIIFDKDRRSAVISLADPEAAKNLVRQEFIDFRGAKLKITWHVELDKSHQPSEKECFSVSDRTIFVSNIPSHVAKQTLEMIFENKRYSGGLIENFIVDRQKGTAAITFKDPEVAKTLIQNGAIVYRGNLLTISKDGAMVDSKQDQNFQKSSVHSWEPQPVDAFISKTSINYKEKEPDLYHPSKRTKKE